MPRIWKGIYCGAEHEEAVNKEMEALFMRLMKDHPEYGFDVDGSWDTCDEDD